MINGVFKGYLIANNNEEYLVNYVQTGHYEGRTWSKRPEFAKTYTNESKAQKVKEKLKNCGWMLKVVRLYESETHYYLLN